MVGIEPGSPYISKCSSLQSLLCPPVYPVILTVYLAALYRVYGCASKGSTLHVSGISKLAEEQISLFCPLTNHQHAVIRSNPPPSYALFEHL